MRRFPAWVEVNLDAMKWNLDRVRDLLGPGTGVLLVVKADAYGHGAVRVARFAEREGVEMLGVATADEGKELRSAGIRTPILILSPVLPEELEAVLEHDLAVNASSLEFAETASRTARKLGRRCIVHVEVDTGMGRAGVHAGEAPETIRRIAALDGLDVEGIFTHFPASDLDAPFTRDQIDRFSGIVDDLAADGIRFRWVHAANSGGVMEFPSSHFNLVRPGLVVYGLVPSTGLDGRLDVHPTMSFRSRVVLVREMPAGASVSYGRTWIAERPFRMGIVPVGYGHGLGHRLSNNGSFLFRGERVPVIGRVTMDMTMIDLSAFPDAAAGEEIVIFGRQGEQAISADELAELIGTINYEILCGISKRVARVYLQRGEVDSFKTLLGMQDGVRLRP